MTTTRKKDEDQRTPGKVISRKIRGQFVSFKYSWRKITTTGQRHSAWSESRESFNADPQNLQKTESCYSDGYSFTEVA